MKLTLIKIDKQSIRFLVVGITNTTLDFGIYLILVSNGLNVIISNYASTTVALGFSFYANRSYTFNDKESNLYKQASYFIVFTLIGIWVIQPLMITLTQTLINNMLPLSAHAFISKLIATIFSLSWNYITYRKFVFKS